jgi:hypothetical protein
LGGPWAFYHKFYPAHNLDNLVDLLSPEIGVGGGQDFPVPLILHNNTGKTVTFHLQTEFPKGWSIDSNSSRWAHHPMPVSVFRVAAHDDYPVRIRLVAPHLNKSEWQNVTWTAEVDGEKVGSVTLKLYDRN